VAATRLDVFSHSQPCHIPRLASRRSLDDILLYAALEIPSQVCTRLMS
jgi:hypothetical protein